MTPEIITASIAAIVAITSTVISIYGQARITKLSDKLTKQRDAESREAKTAALIAKYRDPLLRSAIDLQSRLFNIVKSEWIQRLYNRSQSEQNYAINNTLYVISEHLAWIEILRREIQFLDLGDLEMNRHLSELLVNINQAFRTERVAPTFRLFTGEQRAIGEIMISPTPPREEMLYECIGYASFVKKMSEEEFSRWFEKLQGDIKKLANEKPNMERLILLHHRLIDLIDFLDPNCIRVPPKYRTRI